MGETPEVNLGGGTKLQRPLLPSCSKREDDKRKPPRAGRVDPGHGHEQDGGDTGGDRGDGGRQDRGQLRLGRLPPRDGSAGQGRLRREWLGGLRQRRARPSCTEGKIKNSN